MGGGGRWGGTVGGRVSGAVDWTGVGGSGGMACGMQSRLDARQSGVTRRQGAAHGDGPGHAGLAVVTDADGDGER